MQHAAQIEPSCDRVPSAAPLMPLPIDWSRVAFGIATYNAPHERALLQAAADTWLRMVRGAALLLTTDRDDPRSDAEVAPSASGGVELGVELVVHRCARCCGDAKRPCDGGVVEGWKARTKVAEMFAEMARRWGGGGAEAGGAGGGAAGGAAAGRPARDWFLKLDADSTLVPHNLGALLAELLWLVGAAPPLLLGLARLTGLEPQPSRLKIDLPLTRASSALDRPPAARGGRPLGCATPRAAPGACAASGGARATAGDRDRGQG